MSRKLLVALVIAALPIAAGVIQSAPLATAQASGGQTILAFRTAPGAVKIVPGASRELGIVQVSPFGIIRVVADERVGSPTNVRIRLVITEGNELVAQLDALTLTPHGQVTTVYAVPGTRLTVFADALAPGTGADGVDVLVYGRP